MITWIKRNKLAVALLLLLFVSNAYVLMVVVTGSNAQTIVIPNNTTPPTQINNISNSDGFSVNGNVTNVGTTNVVNPTKTQVVTQTKVVEKTVDNSAGITGTNYNPEGG